VILRSELNRLFQWLKDKSLTVLVTGEAGDGQVTRQGLEEYVSDCVIVLDNRIHNQVSTRRLRIVKYRGSTRGTNEYPFLIDAQRDTDYVDGNGLRRFDRAHFERYSRP
jgi:circadian clock protein KaiC